MSKKPVLNQSVEASISQNDTCPGNCQSPTICSVPVSKCPLTKFRVDPINCMLEGIETYKQRNTKYGESFRDFGGLMMMLFPNGIEVNTMVEWNRLALTMNKVAKLQRYCKNFKIGHIDSTHDEGVYAFMLEALDLEEESKRSDVGQDECFL